MKKLTLGLSALLFSLISFGQTVQDNATIPVSVTLNSILRLQVTTGGNIQFVFNTMDQYSNGIGNTAGTTTTFNVASSTTYAVLLGAEDDALYGVETGDRVAATGSIPLGIITYEITGAGPGGIGAGVNPLTQVPGTNIVPGGLAGTGATNTFNIEWAAGTGAVKAINLPPDVYVTNVFLNLNSR